MPLASSRAVQVIAWEDICVVVDNGRARPHEYKALRTLMTTQAERFSGGIGCLAIIPVNAVPPGDAAREALNVGLQAVAGSLRCMCWLVEGGGFQGAMVRAVLTGLRLVAQRSYATHVSTNMDEALAWLITHLPRSGHKPSDIVAARTAIERERTDLHPVARR